MRDVFANLPMTDDGQVLDLGLCTTTASGSPTGTGGSPGCASRAGGKPAGARDQMHGLRGDWNGRLSPSHEFVFHFNRRPVRAQQGVECIHAGETGGALRSADGSFAAVTSDEIQTHKIPDSVFRIQRQKGGVDGHPAPFSVPLVTAVLRSWDGLVYEPFSGSGTTISACERLGRACRAIELSPGYVAVALERWSAGGASMCAAMHKRRVRGELTKVHAFPAAATATAPREFGPTFGPGLGPEADEDGDDDSNDAESNDFRSDYLVTPPGVEPGLPA
ncbi:MAG: DNA methyltransferase [bacterium]